MTLEEKIKETFDGYEVTNIFNRTFLIKKDETIQFVLKKVHQNTLIGKGFITIEPIHGWSIVRPSITTKFGDDTIEIIIANPDLKIAEPNKETINAVNQFYKQSVSIKFISDIEFSGTARFDNLIEKRKEVFLQIYDGEAVLDVAKEFYEFANSYKKSPELCAHGFVHGDMYTRNILTKNDGMFYLIDFDTVTKSYVVLNLVQFFYINIFKRLVIENELTEEQVIDHLVSLDFISQHDKENFAYFTLLSAFHWELETTPFNAPEDMTRLDWLKMSLDKIKKKSKILTI
jgi:hypothetical protein